MSKWRGMGLLWVGLAIGCGGDEAGSNDADAADTQDTAAEVQDGDATDTTPPEDTRLDVTDTATPPDATDVAPDVDDIGDVSLDIADTTQDTEDAQDTEDTADTAPLDTADTEPADTEPADTTPEDTADTTPEDTADTTVEDTTPVDTTPVNRPPTVALALSPTGPILPGQTTTLTATVSDPDGDLLDLDFVQLSPANPLGSFVTVANNKVTWTAPELATATTFEFSLSVSDGVNDAVVKTGSIQVTIPTFANDIQPIFSNNCTGCHGGSGGLFLTAGQAYTNLVNVTGNNGACSTLKRILPGSPNDSLLVRKISGTTCGDRMPRSDPSFFANNPGLITRIRSWVAAGALNN
ncbi:MAG: hypothetical protein JNJ59_26125 [Deltaproteobacteria bacterium]|nr:hypothetical protein [Deltaproteobacteria bacterium]